MVSIKNSRFAILPVEDDISDVELSNRNENKNNKNGQSQNGAKEKNRKKKKLEQLKMETNELRNKAFGNVTGNKKRKTKNKGPKTVSLGQSNQTKNPPNSSEPRSKESDFEEPLPPKPEIKTALSNPDLAFFDTVGEDVSKILQEEKLQEHFKQQYAAESVLIDKHKNDLASKDKEIEALKKLNSDIKGELTAANELNSELTQEVVELNEHLEKERSKVHQLTTELSKLKVGKYIASNR